MVYRQHQTEYTASINDFSKAYSNLYVAAYDQRPHRIESFLMVMLTRQIERSANIAATLITEFSLGRAHHTILAGMEYISTSSDQDRFQRLMVIHTK